MVNLCGRSIGAAFAHRFLPGTKGGLQAWEKVRHCPEVSCRGAVRLRRVAACRLS
jgi:hypothetical protein